MDYQAQLRLDPTSVQAALGIVHQRLDPNTSGADLFRFATGINCDTDAVAALVRITSDATNRVLTTAGDTLAAAPREVQDRTELCLGSIQGPVLWSETLVAQAVALGADDLFVCRVSSPTRQTTGTAALVWALREIRRDGQVVADAAVLASAAPELVAEATRRSAEANGWLRHRLTTGIEPRRPKGRDLTRMRQGRHGTLWEPVAEFAKHTTGAKRPFHWHQLVNPANLGAAMSMMHAIERFSENQPLPQFSLSATTLRCSGVELDIAGQRPIIVNNHHVIVFSDGPNDTAAQAMADERTRSTGVHTSVANSFEALVELLRPQMRQSSVSSGLVQ